MAPNDRPASVRSHRRGRPRRRYQIKRWMTITTVLVLIAAGLTTGAIYLVDTRCSATVTATIVATPRLEDILRQVAQDWNTTNPTVDNTCANVTVTAKESATVATALADEWDTAAGPAPDVWIPDSSAWARKASVDPDAERLLPDRQPSLARTPTVVAMPKQLADAAALPQTPLTWRQIIARMNAAGGWGSYDHKEWGEFKVGLSDPQTSTAGLLALLSISDTDEDGDISKAEQAALVSLRTAIKVRAGSTDEFLAGLRNASGQGASKALTYISAFPVLEQDVVAYNTAKPTTPLVAVYPKDGTAEADFPYLVLNAPWATTQRQRVAAAFLAHLRGESGRAAFLAAGLRDSNRTAGSVINDDNGVRAKLTTLPRVYLLPESVQHAAAAWTAITRPTNVLFLFDTSGSMADTVAGTGKSRLDLTKAAALDALRLFDDTAKVGIWSFAPFESGDDNLSVLPMTPLGSLTGEKTHRELVNAAVKDLRVDGRPGLFRPVQAACQEARRRYQAGSANLVLLLTDGSAADNGGPLNLAELVSDLKSTCGADDNPVSVVTIGLGGDANSDVLRQISAATKAPSYSSPTSFDISQVVLTALFSPTL